MVSSLSRDRAASAITSASRPDIVSAAPSLFAPTWWLIARAFLGDDSSYHPHRPLVAKTLLPNSNEARRSLADRMGR
jgi:hypothetical protein